jgi:choline kinase
MTIQTAVILAAGMGMRLGKLNQSSPKGFLTIGDRPIVEESVAKLERYGIQRIVIVTGYQAEYYQALQTSYGDRIVTVHNPSYATTGSLYSLYCARSDLQEDFLLLESDLVYESRALETVLAAPQENLVLLSGFTHAGDEVYVQGYRDRIQAMSKDQSQLSGDIVGEFVGITKVSQALFERLLVYAECGFAATRQLAYETDGLVTVAQTDPVHYTRIDNLLWGEIDDQSHLHRVKERIYPLICQQDYAHF